MQELDPTFLDRIGRDNNAKTSKLGRPPVENSLRPHEREKILAALAAANEKFKLFPKK